MSGSSYVAVDLGAESGRVVVGTLEEGRVRLDEVHRFANVAVRTPDGLHWDILRLYAEILDGLRLAAQRYGPALAGIGVDSWGVDYGLIDAGGRLLGNPYSYRDARTDGMPEAAARIVPPQEQYARTGIAQLSFNTVYQLMALGRSDDRTVHLATALLMIPDLLHFWLCGERAAEYTNATTTGALGVDGAWAHDLLARLGAPSHMLLPPAPAGTRIGAVRRAVREACNLEAIPIYLPATHDTGCAVVAVPADPRAGTHAYISCGTWSLLGLELEHPIVSDEARRAGFTNEGGVAGTYRFLTNISGLWLLQECRRAWGRHGTLWDYTDLTNQAAAAPSPNVVFDVDEPAFLHPDDMPAAINAALARSGQQAISYAPDLTRAILENLALKYRVQLERAERLTGTRVAVIHLLGGGVRNGLLCQLTADACKRPVVTGPVEATALGNVLVQAIGAGAIADLAQAHEVARASVELQLYDPRPLDWWDEAYVRLQELPARTEAEAADDR